MTDAPEPVANADAEDLDGWRDDIATITPMGAREWLALPAAYLIVGVGVIALQAWDSLGRSPSFQSWTVIGGGAVFIIWAAVFAWMGRRAYNLYELDASRSYVRFKVAGAGGLCIVATVVGIVAVSPVIAALPYGILWALNRQRQLEARSATASEFRVSRAAILRRAFLIEGIVMTLACVVCALVALFALGLDSIVTIDYVGTGAIFVLAGLLTTVMALQERRQDANGSAAP